VGVALDAGRLRRWHAAAVGEIDRLGCCDVTVFWREAQAPRRAGRLSAAAHHWLYEAYVLADRRWFGHDDDALARVPPERCGGQWVDLPGDWASATAAEAIAARDLDVLLCLAPEAPAERLAGCARFGAWSLHMGATTLGDADCVPVTLRAHTPDAGERTIYRSVIAADRVSLHRGRCRAARRAAQLPARRLRDLSRQAWPPPAVAEDPVGPGPDRPSNTMTARLLWRVARGVVTRRVAGRLGEKQWFIAYRRIAGEASALRLIAPPAGRFYADPFLFRHEGRRFIFFEDYDGRRGRAAIGYVELDAGGRHGAPQPALTQDCHLSYPFVFAEGDAVYMLPETAGRRTVELYRAARFPGEWTLDRVLLSDVVATDATLVRHAGRLWLFVAMAVDGGRPMDELFVFSSTSLGGEWEPHPGNPVVSDVRGARPAGRVIARDGQLIRPAQDCSRVYGWRLVFNRIEVLSRTEYRERPIAAIEPDPESGNLRTHSYDADGVYEVLDGFRLRPRVPLGGGAATGPRWRHIDLEAPGRERSILHS
jgi:hypothetical protein